MKKKLLVLVLLVLIGSTAFPCDLCSIYIGINPNDFKNSFSLRHRYRSFEKEYISTLGNNVSHHNDGHSHSHSNLGSNEGESYYYKETYSSYDLSANFFMGHDRNWQLGVNSSFSDNYVFKDDSIISNVAGIGDVTATLKYQLFNSKKRDSTDQKRFLHRVIIGGGVDLPVGSYNKHSNSFGEIELNPHLQTGTGSFNFPILLEYLIKYNSIGFNGNVSYKINTTNSNGFRFANRLNVNTSLFFLTKLSSTIKIMPNIGLTYEGSNRDVFENEQFKNSGGETIFMNGGINLFINKLSINFSYYSPIYEMLYDEQPLNKERFITQISYYFN